MASSDLTHVPSRSRSRRHSPDEARQIISRAAVRFLARRPFRDLTVGELMASTELSRPAFYQYFRDLHALMESLLEGLIEDISAVANPWLAGEGDPIVALRESLRGVVQVGYEDGPVLRAVSEAAPSDARLERAWSAFMAHWDHAVAARIEVQQEQGFVPSLDARSMASALNALDAAVLIQAFGRRPRSKPEVVLETLHRVWVGALYGRAPTRTAPRS